MPKLTDVIAVRGEYRGSLLLILAQFFRFLRGNFLETPLQNQNKFTNFSQIKLKKIIENVSYSIRYSKI